MLEAKQKGEPHFYMMELGQGLIIDARDRGTVARLINSSCDPNAESQKWHDAGTGGVSPRLVHVLSITITVIPQTSIPQNSAPMIQPARVRLMHVLVQIAGD